MKVFISAASSDRKIAAFVQRELEQKQIDTFTIEDNLKPGEMVFDAIKRSIKNSQSYLIFLSKAVETNQNVLNEMDYIILEWKNDPTKKLYLLSLTKM